MISCFLKLVSLKSSKELLSPYFSLMLKKLTSRLWLAIPSVAAMIVFSSAAYAAQTGSVWLDGAAATFNVNGIALTISAESNATSVIVGETTLSVVTGAGDTFTVTSGGNYEMATNSPTVKLSCLGTSTRIIVPASTTIVISPSGSTPNCSAGSSAGSGGGSSGSSSPAPSSPATPATPAVPATPGVTPATPAVPATPATPATKIVIDLPPIKGALEVQEVTLPTSGKIAAKTNLVNATGDVSIELAKNVKLTGLKAGQTLQAPVETDPATVSVVKATGLKKKSVVAAYDLDTDAVKSSKTVKIQVALGTMADTKGLKAYLLDEKTGKTKTVLGSFSKKTGVFTARTKYLGGFTLVFTLPTPVAKK